jgi:hypothetical protein
MGDSRTGSPKRVPEPVAQELATDVNVAASLPGDADYSPLWSVTIYDNADFDSVSDLSSALDAAPVGPGPLVNCPIVSVEEP